MKKYIFIIYFLIFSLSAFLRAETYDAKVENLSNRRYFEKTLVSLNEAKKSIVIGMYIITLSKEGNSKVKQLLDALISAKNRGVSVKVIMEYHSGLDLTPQGMRNNAYKYLLENGIDVNFDESAHRCAHLKAIVIDDEIVITGSSNWSNLAITTNDEINVLIYSRPLAEEISKEILSIPLFHSLSASAEEYFDIQLLMQYKILPEIISVKDERALDIILLLLYNGKDTIGFDFIAEKLGLLERMNRTSYRQQIIKVLKKIEKKYKPAEFDIKHGRDEIGVRWNTAEQGREVLISKEYFDSNWHKTLLMPGKAALAAICAESSGRKTGDIEIPISYLAKKYELKLDIFSRGLQELKYYNIVKVYYSKGFQYRKTTKMSFTGPYNTAIFKNKVEELYKKYGRRNAAYAGNLANIVYCKYDINVVRDILEQINSRGAHVVRKAFYIAAGKNPDNPQRNYIYTRGIIKKLAEKQ